MQGFVDRQNSLKAMQCKLIELISAPKLLETAAQDIAQLRRSFDPVSSLFCQWEKFLEALSFMPRISMVKNCL